MAAALLSIAMLAGCQPLPQPFKPDDARKVANPLLDLPGSAGIVVAPVGGLPAETGAALAREMADALIRRELPAFVGDGNPASYRLAGQARGRVLIWRLTDPDGRIMGETLLDGARDDLEQAASLRGVAERSAGRVAAMIQGPPARDTAAPVVKRSLYVPPIGGPPTPAAEVLREELENALQTHGLRIARRSSDDTIAVAGIATTRAAPGGKYLLTLDWTIQRTDGKSLGTLRQSNAVAGDELETAWPTIARAIALATAAGVKELLDRTPESDLSATP